MSADNEEQPIGALAELESPVSETFLNQFRRKVYRRTATSQLTQFSTSVPLKIFIEFLAIIMGLFDSTDRGKGRSSK